MCHERHRTAGEHLPASGRNWNEAKVHSCVDRVDIVRKLDTSSEKGENCVYESSEMIHYVTQVDMCESGSIERNCESSVECFACLENRSALQAFLPASVI